VSDHSCDELHAFAERLGVPRRAFQGDHYDLPAEHRLAAIELGAEAVDARALVRRLRASGLRFGPAQRRQLPLQVAAGPPVEGGVGPIGDVQTRPAGEATQDG